MSLLSRLFGKRQPSNPEGAKASEQAVLVHLDPSRTRGGELGNLEDALVEVIRSGGLGEFDGNEVSESAVTLYLYGPDAERLFSRIEPTLRASSLCAGAAVVVRLGGPGAPERRLRL